MKIRRRSAMLVLSTVVLALVLAACGDDTATIPATKTDAKPKPATEPTADTKLTKDLTKDLAALVTAGCAYGVHEEEEANHVSEDELKWKTFPPASGTHLDNWVDFGLFDEPVNDGYVVHNMEHGGVVAFLGEDVSKEQQTAIEGLLDDEEKWVVVPKPDLEGLAVNAWAKSLVCSPDALAKVDADALGTALDAWYDAVNSQGSEAEKDLAAYGGGLDEPKPSTNISAEAPF